MKTITIIIHGIALCMVTACGSGGSSSDKSASPASYSSSSVTSSKQSSISSSAQSSTPSDNDFTLVFRDDFNSFDSNRWQLMDHSWGGNLALFSSETVSVENGMMKIRLAHAPAGTTSGGEAKPYLGAEVRSVDSIAYGRVSARAKLAKGSAVVSALVTIYTPWPADNWNEFDIESLGKNTREIQFNSMVYTGPELTTQPSTSVTPTQYPTIAQLDFDSSEDFHIYTIEWTPNEAKFLIDDVVYHRWVDRMDLIGLPQNILMTIWASNIVEWAGPVNSDTVNAEALYDWIEVWEYNH